ncbi:hypothetical protein psal_cds_322 [Pandoravirus salinus]|uniref:Uncharacterized protein n=1 Tax=Pandoravirus salinus TaxID=1349410 RepID=S4VUC6_9VIRU|nr:hypothetical protein psal_cds_322 [Pandoravirus salinus]AGO83948.1 hypothetical protein psal_cds_322 [Pandoravirus salinus]
MCVGAWVQRRDGLEGRRARASLADRRQRRGKRWRNGALRMSSTGSYRPEAWAYADQRGVRTGAGVPVDLGGGPPNDNSNSSNGGHAAGCASAYYDRHAAADYADECARPCAVTLTPRARWSPPQTSALYDQGQPATPDMALIIERLLDDLDREREARARAEGRTSVTATASSLTTTTPATTATHAVQFGPSGQSTAVVTQQTAQPQSQQQQPQVQHQYLLPPPPPVSSNATSVPPVVMVAPAPTAGLVGSGATATPNATSAPAPPGTTSNRTLLLALIPIVVIALLFAAWVVWRLSGIERRLTAVAAHAVSTAPPPLVSPVVSPVVTGPAPAPATSAPQRGGMLAVDTNNQYYYARPITS